MKELSRYIIDTATDAIFPYRCVCGKWGKPLCETCTIAIESTKSELCPLCKRLSPYGQTCSSCRGKSHLTGVMVAGTHEGILKSVIWKLKYGPIKALSIPLGDILYDKYGHFIISKKADITFTPTSKHRKRQRGYNQAEDLAARIAEKTHLHLVSVLARPKDVLHQVGLTRQERIDNAKGTISYLGQKPTNTRIVVVDDVYTTGATLEECAKVLRENGYREVWGMVLSRD